MPGVGKKEYVPSHMYEINKYLTDYIYNIGKNFNLAYSITDDGSSTSFNEQIMFTVRKGPGYESNAPKLVSRYIPSCYGDDCTTGENLVEFMSPVLPYASYSEILPITISGIKDMKIDYDFYTCGDLGGKLKLEKPDNADVGIFNLIFTPINADRVTTYPPITYYNYHVDPIVNDLTDIQDFDLNDFLNKSPDLKARLCALKNAPIPEQNDPHRTGLSIFDQFLKDSALFNLVSTTDCDDFINNTYCATGTDDIKYRRTCSCLKKYPYFKDNDKEEKLYNFLIKTNPDIPVKCISTYCRNGGYYNTNTEKCPNVCTTGVSCDITTDGTSSEVITVQCSDEQILILPSPAEKAAADKKQADLLAQEKKNKDAEDEKNNTIVNNFLNLQRNISSQKFNLIMSIIIIFAFFLGSVFLLYKIIKRK